MSQIVFVIIAVTFVNYTSGNILDKLFKGTTENPESWTGRWLPERLPTVTEAPRGREGGEPKKNMGDRDLCDDGETNLSRDWSGDPSFYHCMNPRNRIGVNFDLKPMIEYENIPKAYQAAHRCMNDSITYNSDVPTFGTHRQLWPVYGEYKYLPAQRWLHTLEHGGIVALYHPCANKEEINLLRKSVQGCLRRHVITPWPYLDKDRPFALVAWGVRMRMSLVIPRLIMGFVQEHALLGPEHISTDGQFRNMLISSAEVVSDFDDSNLCPIVLAHD